MLDTDIILKITNSTFRFNIPIELFNMRNEFCPAKGRIKCSHDCLIHYAYYSKGLSCNGALDKFPDECVKIMNEFRKEDF